MESFFYISQKIMNPNIDPYIYTKDFAVQHKFFQTLHQTKIKKENDLFINNFLQNFFYVYVIFNDRNTGKFKLLESIFQNIFCSNEFKEELLNLFCKIQKINNAFSKLAYIYKNKKAPIKIKTDMFLNTIDEKEKNVICIFDPNNSCKYLFTINDLIKIIKKSLIHSPHFFSDPSECKNPYTNIPFNKSTLYNIYFFIKYKNYIMPELIQNFFIENFNLENFRKNNLYTIRENAISDYLVNLKPEDAEEYIHQMIKSYYKKKTYISEDFPRNKLIEIMKPYLNYYFITTYSLCHEKRNEYYYKLCVKLRRFFKFNPHFGKKFIKFERVTRLGYPENPFDFKNRIRRKVTFFNDSHINFYEKENDKFLTSHVKNETGYDSPADDEDNNNDVNIENNHEIDTDTDTDFDNVEWSESDNENNNIVSNQQVEEEDEEEEWNQLRNQMENEVQEVLLNQENENENEENENDSVS